MPLDLTPEEIAQLYPQEQAGPVDQFVGPPDPYSQYPTGQIAGPPAPNDYLYPPGTVMGPPAPDRALNPGAQNYDWSPYPQTYAGQGTAYNPQPTGGMPQRVPDYQSKPDASQLPEEVPWDETEGGLRTQGIRTLKGNQWGMDYGPRGQLYQGPPLTGQQAADYNLQAQVRGMINSGDAPTQRAGMALWAHHLAQKAQQAAEFTINDNNTLKKLQSQQAAITNDQNLSPAEKAQAIAGIQPQIDALNGKNHAAQRQMEIQQEQKLEHANQVQQGMAMMDGKAWEAHFRAHSVPLPDGSMVYMKPDGTPVHINSKNPEGFDPVKEWHKAESEAKATTSLGDNTATYKSDIQNRAMEIYDQKKESFDRRANPSNYSPEGKRLGSAFAPRGADESAPPEAAPAPPPPAAQPPAEPAAVPTVKVGDKEVAAPTVIQGHQERMANDPAYRQMVEKDQARKFAAALPPETPARERKIAGMTDEELAKTYDQWREKKGYSGQGMTEDEQKADDNRLAHAALTLGVRGAPILESRDVKKGALEKAKADIMRHGYSSTFLEGGWATKNIPVE